MGSGRVRAATCRGDRKREAAGFRPTRGGRSGKLALLPPSGLSEIRRRLGQAHATAPSGRGSTFGGGSGKLAHPPLPASSTT